jgi:hypothetical protein
VDCISDLEALYDKRAAYELLTQLAEQGWTLGDYQYAASPDPDHIPGEVEEAMASLVKMGKVVDSGRLRQGRPGKWQTVCIATIHKEALQ